MFEKITYVISFKRVLIRYSISFDFSATFMMFVKSFVK